MNMKKLLIALTLLTFTGVDVSAQGFLKKLKDKVVEKAQEKVENKVEKTVSDQMDEVLDGKSSTSKKGKKAKDFEIDDVSEADPTTATSSDFKRGSVVMFEDDVTAEQIGEFPSKWDLFQGTVETKTLGGVKAINLTDNAQIQPFIKEKGAYLPEEFTIEYDFYYWPTSSVPGNDGIGLNDMKLILAVTKDRSPMDSVRTISLPPFFMPSSIISGVTRPVSSTTSRTIGLYPRRSTVTICQAGASALSMIRLSLGKSKALRAYSSATEGLLRATAPSHPVYSFTA